MTIQILVLDDNEERHGAFREIFNNDEFTLTHVKTSQVAIDALKRQKFDTVFLDHDLGDFNNDPRIDPGDGLEVAEFLALHMERKNLPDNVVIHSHNPSAAQRMKFVLNENDIWPLVLSFSLQNIKSVCRALSKI